ncbi:hypothetical protein [Actinomadura sp. 6N118]
MRNGKRQGWRLLHATLITFEPIYGPVHHEVAVTLHSLGPLAQP